MLKNISNKRKFHLLIALISLFSVLGYQKSFKNTVSMVSNYYESKQKINSVKRTDEQIANLMDSIKELDSRIGKNFENPDLVQNEILEFLSRQNFDVKISKIGSVHLFKNEYFSIYTNTITLKGGYNDLALAIHTLENEFQYAKVASLKLFANRNSRTRKRELYNTLIFQNYEKN